MHDFTPLQGLRKNQLENISLTCSRETFPYDESCKLTVRVSFMGGMRDSFSSKVWMDAHRKNDKLIRIKYTVGIKKVVAGVAASNLIEPQTFLRKATIYWTRNPEMVNAFERRVWPMLILEGSQPYLPTSEEDARSRLFDLDASFQILGADIGRGNHALKAKASATWGRHIFSEKGRASTLSNAIKITCR